MTKHVIHLCKAAAIARGGVLQATPPGYDDGIAIYNLDGQFFATDDMCTHATASLSQGEIDDGKILCPLHGGAFDIRTGAAVEFPCTKPLKTYKVVEREGELYIEGA